VRTDKSRPQPASSIVWRINLPINEHFDSIAIPYYDRIFLGVHFTLDMTGAVAVAAVAYGVIVPLWRMVGEAITSVAERLYRAVLARPIASGWVRR
jgi:hypothetical protein